MYSFLIFALRIMLTRSQDAQPAESEKQGEQETAEDSTKVDGADQLVATTQGEEDAEQEHEGEGDQGEGANTNASFGNNSFAGGDMNQMQMMMAMQSGMMPGFPMMGTFHILPSALPFV